MASVKKKDIPVLGAFMTEFWEVIKKLYIPEDTDEYCMAVVESLTELSEKYPDPLARKLLTAYMEYLDEQWKSQHNKNEAEWGKGFFA